VLTPISRPPAKAVKKNLKARFADGDTSDEDDVNAPLAFRDLPTIPSFCATLATQTTTKPSPKCIGLLISTDRHEHCVWTPLQQFPKPPRLVSLAHLITTYTNIQDKPSNKSRLVLGLKLISSILQLSTTQWLTGVWGAQDILFPEAGPQAADENHRRNILSRPLVHRDFSSSSSTAVSDGDPDSQQEPANKVQAVIGCNKSLYSLGIVLLEIWHWQTFESLYQSTAHRLSELSFSYLLSEMLFEDAGLEYATAVRRCIRGFEMRETDLEDESFRRKVYQDILGLLEKNLRSFSSDSIPKIMGEE